MEKTNYIKWRFYVQVSADRFEFMDVVSTDVKTAWAEAALKGVVCNYWILQ